MRARTRGSYRAASLAIRRRCRAKDSGAENPPVRLRSGISSIIGTRIRSIRAPRADQRCSARSNDAATGALRSSSTCVCGTAKRSRSTGRESSGAPTSPARIASIVAQHATVVASGPTESSVVDSGWTPSRGTRCAVGLKPTSPQNAAGIRQEPPVSVPMPANAIRSATDTAAPEEDPPGIRFAGRSQGLRGVP